MAIKRIANKTYCNSIKKNTFLSNLNKLPTKNDIETAGLDVSTIKSSNRLVTEDLIDYTPTEMIYGAAYLMTTSKTHKLTQRDLGFIGYAANDGYNGVIIQTSLKNDLKDVSIKLSNDKGFSFSTISSMDNEYQNGIAYGNNKYLSVTNYNNKVRTRLYNGSTWTSPIDIDGSDMDYGNIHKVRWVKDKFFIVGNGKVFYSTDGIDWKLSMNNNRNFRDITSDGDSYILVDEGNTMYRSSSAILGYWSEYTINVLESSEIIYTLSYGSNQLIAGTNKGNILRLPDTSSSWIKTHLDKAISINHMIYSYGTFAGFSFRASEDTGSWAKLIKSSDGINWTTTDIIDENGELINNFTFGVELI